MKKIMVHIDSEEDYEAIDELRSLINGRYSDDIRFPKLFRDRALIDKMNQLKISDPLLYEKICNLSLKIKKKSKALNIDYRLLEKKKHPLGWLVAGLVGLLITFPLFLYGNIFNLTFLEIPSLQTRKIRDIQFHATMRYGISLTLALIILPVFFILSLIIFQNWWLAIVIFLSLPLTGLFAWNYFLQFRRITGGFRIRRYLKNKNKDFSLLKQNYEEIVKIIAGLNE
jgi:hypothetical protein